MKKLFFIFLFTISFLLFSYSVHAATFDDLINYFSSLFTSVSNAITGGGFGRQIDRERIDRLTTTIRPTTTTIPTTTSSTTTTTILDNIVIRTDKPSYNYGEGLNWNVSGLPPNAVISMSIPDASIGFAPDNVADSTGFVSGSFTPSDYLEPGNHTLRATLKSNSSKYVETKFVLNCPSAGCLTSPIKIYDSGKIEWWIKKSWVYNEYINHKSDVEVFYPLPDKIYNWYISNLGGEDKMNFKIKFFLDTPGGGYAGGQEFGIAIDAFWNVKNGLKGWWAYQLITHEFGNLYTGNTMSGGWPCDWWADHGACPSVPGVESPAPMSFANVALQEINWRSSENVSRDVYNENKNDVLFIMFRDKLIGQYGIGMFNHSFAAIRQDGMDWTKIDGGKNPSGLLTNYVAAYLTIGAGTDLSPIFNNYANQSYPAGMTGFDSKVVNDIITARKLIYDAISQGKCVDAAWSAYKSGNYSNAINLIGTCTSTTTISTTSTTTTIPANCSMECKKMGYGTGTCRSYAVVPGAVICLSNETNIGPTGDCQTPSGWAGGGKSCCCANKCAKEGEYTSGAVAPEYYYGCCEGLEGFNTHADSGWAGGGLLCYNPQKGTPICKNVGSSSEGWYYPKTGELLRYENCGIKSYKIQFYPGWNMFSIPVKMGYTTTTSKGVQVTEVFTKATTTTTVPGGGGGGGGSVERICSGDSLASKIWHYSNGKYVEAISIESGEGYWVKMKYDCVIFVEGEPVTINDFPRLNTGWNQIGGPAESIQFSAVVGDCKVTGGPWNYNTLIGQYEKSDYLKAGEGYWIRVGDTCTLGSEVPPSPPLIGSILGNILTQIVGIGG